MFWGTPLHKETGVPLLKRRWIGTPHHHAQPPAALARSKRCKVYLLRSSQHSQHFRVRTALRTAIASQRLGFFMKGVSIPPGIEKKTLNTEPEAPISVWPILTAIDWRPRAYGTEVKDLFVLLKFLADSDSPSQLCHPRGLPWFQPPKWGAGLGWLHQNQWYMVFTTGLPLVPHAWENPFWTLQMSPLHMARFTGWSKLARNLVEHQFRHTKRLSVGYWTNRYWSVLFHLTIFAWDIFDIQKDADYAYVSQANVWPIDLELFCCCALSPDHDRDDRRRGADLAASQSQQRPPMSEGHGTMGPWDNPNRLIPRIPRSPNPTSHQYSSVVSSWTNIM